MATEQRWRAIRYLLSVACGFLTGEVLGLVGAHSAPRGALSAFTDYLSMPGAIVAMVFYPFGLDTGSLAWIVITYLSNLAVYSVVWFVAITAMRRSYRRKKG